MKKYPGSFLFPLALVAGVAIGFLGTVVPAEAAPIRVVVWDERQPAQSKAYENSLGNAIAAYLTNQPGLTVKSVCINDPEQGLSNDVLDHCDVLIWWGHVRHADVIDEHVRAIMDRLQKGKLSLISLHSAHWSKPFMEAMNLRTIEDALATVPKAKQSKIKIVRVPPAGQTVAKSGEPLTPSWREVKAADGTDTLEIQLPRCIFPVVQNKGKPSHVTTLLPQHPIAKDIPAKFDIPKTEMYAGDFHVPKPDAVVFEERWDTDNGTFTSGCVWRVGKGKVFYFRPGHETFPVFKQEETLKIIANAVRWARP